MELINRILYNVMEVHPLHTLIVHFPIALTSTALFFILLALWQRNRTLEQVAFANIALASVSTLVAGVTGWIDNINTYDSAAPNSGAKVVLALLLLVITTLITIARWRNPAIFESGARLFYIGGYFVSFGLVAVLGFLGGVILYGFEAQPNPPVVENYIDPETISHISTLTPEPASDEVTASGVSFTKDILPILKSRCANCHGGQKIEDDLDLTSYTALMAGSKNGSVIAPSNASNSPLAQVLIEKEMPKRGPKLSLDQSQLIIDWINQGALDN